MKEIDAAFLQFEKQCPDWAFFRDYEKREMAFKAGAAHSLSIAHALFLVLHSLIAFDESRVPPRGGLMDLLTIGDNVRAAYDILLRHKTLMEEYSALLESKIQLEGVDG